MTECFHDKRAKKRLSLLAPYQKTTRSVALYVKNEDLTNLTNDEIILKKYVILNTIKSVEKIKATIKELNIVTEKFKKSSVSEYFQFDKSTPLTHNGTEQIEFYKINNHSSSLINLSKISSQNVEYYVVFVSNILLVKNRILILNFYQKYENFESINFAKKNNEEIVLEFLKSNS